MILEGLITTMDAAGRMHVAAMGPEIDEREVLSGTVKQLILKPFDTSQTAANLATHPAGVSACRHCAGLDLGQRLPKL